MTSPASLPALLQEVIPGLWIGDYQAAQSAKLLEQNGIVAVVSASTSFPFVPTVLKGAVESGGTFCEAHEVAGGVADDGSGSKLGGGGGR
jgi:hypothetical protein